MYKLIVDTEQYAGNFEREMCAFITGQVGECGVGQDLATAELPNIKHASWWDEHASHESDDNGCCRPVAIASTPGWFNSGMGKHHRDTNDQAELDTIKNQVIQSHIDYDARQRKMVEQRLADSDFETTPHGWTKDACERTLKTMDDRLESIKNDPLGRYPACLSVAVFVDVLPPDEVWAEFQERAKIFALERPGARPWNKETITVTGFRQEPLVPQRKPKRH